MATILFGIVAICRPDSNAIIFKSKSLIYFFFVPSLESTSNFEHFEKKMIVIATLVRKLQTVKDLF